MASLLRGEGKTASLALSSDAAFRGDGSRYSPEELLVGSLSSTVRRVGWRSTRTGQGNLRG
ncbi:MAG: hypothetical protein SGI92_14290 [Bryobacteraceae bacterium]|nr:hypothetical protein [Bryobacteraceae bacterium]